MTVPIDHVIQDRSEDYITITTLSYRSDLMRLLRYSQSESNHCETDERRDPWYVAVRGPSSYHQTCRDEGRAP